MAKPPIRIKRSAVSGSVPTTAQLALGELAINTADGKVFLKKDDGTASIVEIGSGGAYTSPVALALYEKTDSGSTDAFDGVETRFQLRDSSGNYVTIANALYVAISVNGVVQKPNTGTPSSPFEGFYITANSSQGYDIVFDTAPAASADFFGVLAGTFTATQGTSGVKILDDISSGFNTVDTAFTLQFNGTTYTPDFPNAIIVSLGGVVQVPTDAYSISGSTITFTAAPPTGTSFHALSFEIGAGVDGITSITASSPLASTGGTTPILSIQDASTSQKGAVQLEDSTSSTSVTTAATPNAVKAAYDLASAAGATGGGTDKVFYENDQTVTTNYTLTGKNALTAGPISINSGVVVTINAGANWVII